MMLYIHTYKMQSMCYINIPIRYYIILTYKCYN